MGRRLRIALVAMGLAGCPGFYIILETFGPGSLGDFKITVTEMP